MNKFVVLFFLFLSDLVNASTFEVKLGPPSVGLGGPNPISMPPINFLDYEFTYVTEGNWEYSLAAVPGLTFGKRIYMDNYYAALGSGLFLSSDGAGFGCYSALGLNSTANKKSKSLGYVAEYKQSLAFNAYGLIMSYAIRLGLAYKF